MEKHGGTFKDLTGMVFGKLTVIRYAGKTSDKYHRVLWECICSCDNKKVIKKAALLSNGHTKSCGCILESIAGNQVATHRLSKSSEYNAWIDMRKRCYVTTTVNYHDYGGRGIIVCDRWLNSFENFIADMGMKPTKGHSLDRIETNGNYEPSNCRWATRKEQNKNKRNNTWYEHDGTRMILSDWGVFFKVNQSSAWEYIKNHGFEKAYIHYTSKLPM